MAHDGLSISTIEQQLRSLGVQPGQTLQVHTAFSKVGTVESGPAGLIKALRATLGNLGTLVMPSMTDDDDSPFDIQATPCLGMGVTADTFWRLPDVLRSDSPHAFAASGPLAGRITASHPLTLPHGPDSPVGRVHALEGQVLLLGVGHESNTTVHLGEYLARVRYRRRKYVTVLQDGLPRRLEYDEIDHCCEKFNLLDSWLSKKKLQRRGVVGHAEARLIAAKAIVKVVVEQLTTDETAFLHPRGTDPECDEALVNMEM